MTQDEKMRIRKILSSDINLMSFDEDLQAMRKGREDLMRLSEEASERAMHVRCTCNAQEGG
ncbi:hypothetical protein M438DRAFT_347429 [Aureobasidium pullulans EXF-150]|uniref:Uncharacterized protein n=1 Tax=Aureobasidium pullulans EXF-150 TaxID=1043002 RepID=A0A074X9Y9_AURPU|nr:uncharacterized protein M438DRAFT_347429 [Aureobasidium pullulans EXF-150]KEQ82158.1 hypothetical protein M438DRAFT_347429 [Aureobasidium pullulans EXF-150]